MLAEFIDKYKINTFNQSIDAEQIVQLQEHLRDEVNDKQEQIHRLYVDKKSEIDRIDNQTRRLIEHCERCETKRNDLAEQIENYSKLESQARLLNSNYHQIHSLNQFADGLQRLIDLDNQIEECRKLNRKRNLSEAKRSLKKIESMVDDEYLFPNKGAISKDSMFEEFERSIRQIRSDINQMHAALWNDGVDRNKKNLLVLNNDDLDRLFQCDLIEEKSEKDLVEKQIEIFSKNFLEFYPKELIDKGKRLIVDEENPKEIFIRIENSGEENEKSDVEQFDEAIRNLRVVLQILNANLLSRSMRIFSEQTRSLAKVKVMEVFSEQTSNGLIDFIRERLLIRIPNDFDQLEYFRSFLENIKNFEKFLIEIEFCSERQSKSPLSSVIGNVEEAILKSRCRDYLVKCRESLKATEHIENSSRTVEVGDDDQVFLENERQKEIHANQTQNGLFSPTVYLDELEVNMFRFPRTIIADDVLRYMKFVREVLKEAENTENYASHLCSTARNMIELFQIIHFSLNEKSAREFSYLTALHFNSYMFIAHQCLLLGEEFYHLKSKTGDGRPITFVDFVPIFRNQAALLLKTQLDIQQNILTDYIKQIGSFGNIANEDENRDILKRAINQCILHLGNLATNWRSIFSQFVYFKVIGYLCDHVCQLLIKETIRLEDIPEEECQLMVDAFSQWSNFLQDRLIRDEKSPGLNTLARLIPNMNRFNELSVVLNSSLQTIVDRWLNGQGPLAAQYTAIEVKQLIRALFQTSDRRTAALSKIQ